MLGVSLGKPWIFSLLGLFIAGVCVIGGLTAIKMTRQLDIARRSYESRRRQLVEAIEGIAEACLFFDTPITGGTTF